MENYRLTVLQLLCFFIALLQVHVHASPVTRRDLGTELLKLGTFAGGIGRRDVISPKITSPDSSSVWDVGSTQVVTWDTSDFPPDSQITNPIGKVILGHDTGDSLNLDFEHPLAQGFKLRDGKVSIVVPDVPPRDDYLIVLMGDSGNTSPTFAITKITGGSTKTPTGTATISGPPTSSTLITNPIPITGSTITGGISDTTIPSSFDTPTSTADVSVSVTASSATVTPTSPLSSSTSLASAVAASTSTSGQTSGALSMASGILKVEMIVGLSALWLAL